MGPTELASTRVRVHIENLVDDRVEVHKPSIFSQVVLRFAQESVCLAVATMDGDFTRFCERFHNFNFVGKTCNVSISRKYENAGRERRNLPLNVGTSGWNGWWREFVAADVGGRITVNDSCNGTINGDGISLARCGISLFIESVVFASGFLGGSGAGSSQRARSPFTIATEALMRSGTCIDSLAQELFSNQYT